MTINPVETASKIERVELSGMTIEALAPEPGSLRFVFRGEYDEDSFDAIEVELDRLVSSLCNGTLRVLDMHFEQVVDLSSTVMGFFGAWIHEARNRAKQIRLHYRTNNAWERGFSLILRSVSKLASGDGGSVELCPEP